MIKRMEQKMITFNSEHIKEAILDDGLTGEFKAIFSPPLLLSLLSIVWWMSLVSWPSLFLVMTCLVVSVTL